MPQLPSVIADMLGALDTAQIATPASNTGDFSYLKMNKMGEWVYGAEEIEVNSDSVFVIDPMSYAQGYVAWSEDGDLIEEIMALAGQPPITLAGLPKLDVGTWQVQVAFALKGIEGAEDGVQVLYKTSSQGGKEAISGLLSQIIARGRSGKTACCPVVLLDTSNYKHKKYGKIFKPVLTVDDWLDVPTSGEATMKAMVKPDPTPEPTPDPTPEPTPEPAKPARKRRVKRTD